MKNCLLAVIGLTLAASAAPVKSSIAPDPARVKQIAAWLPPEPHAPGAPITNRAAWARLAALPEAKTIIRQAEKLLKAPVPELPDDLYLECSRTGNRSHYQRPYSLRVNQFQTLLLAECLENRGRFLPALRERLAAFAAERSWTMPAHDLRLTNFNRTGLTIDLGSSDRAWFLALALDWLGDRVSPELRARVASEIRRRVLDVYLAAVHANNVKGNWWIQGDNNWNAVCHAGVVSAALTLLPSRDERAEIVAAAEKANAAFLAGFTPDGYCSEGMGYWNYGFGHEMLMALTLRAATGGKLDLVAGEKPRRVAAYAAAYLIEPRLCPAFADGGGVPDILNWAFMRQIWPDLVPSDAPASPLLSGTASDVSLRAFGQNPGPAAAPKPAALPIRSWFPDAQVLICRPAPGSAALPFGLGLKGGHNDEHHNHNDVGSYTLALGGTEMAGDPGGEVYTRRTFSKDRYVSQVLNSFGHPVPVVAGKLQPTGRAYAAKVLRTSFTPERDEIELDLTGAYAVQELQSLRRTFSYDRSGRALTITDSVRFAKPCAFSDPLVTHLGFERSPDPARVGLTNATRRASVAIAVQGSPYDLEETLLDNPGRPASRRLAVTLRQPVTAATVTFTFRP